MFHLDLARPTGRATAIVAAALLALGAVAALAPGTSGAHRGAHGSQKESGDQKEELRKAREATKAFRDVEAARRAGYEKAGECESDPKYGAMGIHYVNEELVADGVLDITKPEILVYEPKRNGELRLGAIEYFQVDADQDLHTSDDRPSLFGLPFDGPMLGHNPQMPIHYDLHVWLYKHNPAGRFAMWNPNVTCPEPEEARG